MIVSVIGVSGALAVRVRQQSTSLGGNLIAARHLAVAALEVALYEINNDPNWRDSHTDGVWWTNRALGLGTVELRATDPSDGDLTDSICDPLILTAYGRQGDARQVVRVELRADALDHAPHYQLVESFNPVAYWRLDDETDASLLDTTGAYPGRHRNGVLPNQSVDHSCNTAAWFDGVNDLIRLDYSADFNVNDGTVSAWFMTDRPTYSQGLWGRDATGYGDGGHISIWLLGGKLVARLESLDSSYQIESGAISADVWHHVCLVFGSTGAHLYLDGVLQDSDPYTGGFSSEEEGWAGSEEPFGLGVEVANSNEGNLVGWSSAFRGYIDEFVLFDTALDAMAVQALYDTGVQPPPTTMSVVEGTFAPVVD
jgi:hypothetical protein